MPDEVLIATGICGQTSFFLMIRFEQKKKKMFQAVMVGNKAKERTIQISFV